MRKSVKGFINGLVNWFVKDILAKAVAAPVIVFVVTFGASILDIFNKLQSPILTYIQEHPIRITITALIFGFLASSLFVFAKKYIDRKRLIEATGLSSFWPHSTPEQKSDNWANCLHRVEQGASDLRILGATGWNTYGRLDSPLHDAIRNFRGDIRILLMDPTCPFLKERAESIGMRPEDYAEEINQTIECCRKLKKNGKEIKVKTYVQKPIWKMIII